MNLNAGPRIQRLINVYLFLNVIGFCGWNLYQVMIDERLRYGEFGFVIQNIVLGAVLLFRKDSVAVDSNILHQLVAIIAFCSGALFMGSASTGSPTLLIISDYVIITANILGICTLLNLGKSFGILIAVREVKTSGLYSVVRHPMYGTDILLRIGYLVSHFNVFTAMIFALSTACYVYRAILEEKFLSETPEYKEYMTRVHYRFLPYVL